MNLREALEGGPVFMTQLPRGVRRAVAQVSIESEKDLDRVEAEERKARNRAKARSYYLANRERLIRANTERRRKNAEAAKAWRAKWRKDNPDKARAIARRLAREAYADPVKRAKLLERQKAMHIKHRERRLAYMREYQRKNRELITERRRAARELRKAAMVNTGEAIAATMEALGRAK